MLSLFLHALYPALSHAEPATSRPATASSSKAKPTAPQAEQPKKQPASPQPSPKDSDRQTDIIVVTGARGERRLKDTVESIEVITRQQIEGTSAMNLADVLQTHAGIQLSFDQGGGIGLRLQGLDAKHILILIDGERLSGRVRGVIDLQRFPLERIERIEIIKGPASALYGSDAIGGVVNIITRQSKKPLEFGAFGRYGYGDSHLLDLSGYLGLKRKKWDLQLSVGWHRYDAYALPERPYPQATSASSNEIVLVEGSTSYRFSPKLRLRLRAQYLYQDRAGVDGSATGATFDRKNRTETSSLTLSTDSLFPTMTRLKTSIHFAYFRDQFLYDQRGSNALDQYQETFDWLVQANVQADHAFNAHHILTVGMEALYEHLFADRIRDNLAQRVRGAIYTQYEWLPLLNAPRLSILPGLRIELDSQFGFAINPKLAVRFDPIAGLTLRASYGRAFRAPSFRELYLIFENNSVGYVVEGNPNLQPEFAGGLQLGVEWQALSWLSFSLQGFRNDIDNLIFEQVVNDPNNPTGFRVQYVNLKAAISQGIEAIVRFRAGRIFNAEIGYTLNDTWDQNTERPLPLRPLHSGHAQLTFIDPWLQIQFTARGILVGERLVFLDTNGDGKEETQRIAPYFLFHARISRAFWEKRFEVFLALDNILSTGDHLWLPIRPRTFFVGLRGRY